MARDDHSSPGGITLALLSAVLFGTSTPLAKMLLGNVNPWMMASLLYVGAGLGLAAVHLSRNALQFPAAEAPLRRSDLPWLGALTEVNAPMPTPDFQDAAAAGAVHSSPPRPNSATSRAQR